MYLCSIFLHALYILNYWFEALQGSEHNSSTVFLLKGKDLFMVLKMQIPPGQFEWRFIGERIIRFQPKGQPEYFDGTRAEFSTENYSLQIKNVGLNDSGLYEAVDISGKKDKVIAEYNVIVQGSEHHVPPVFLLKGKDLFMGLKTPKPTSQFIWRFKRKINIIRHKPNQISGTENFYGKRAMFSSENYSVQIKDVGFKDSGLYQAIDSGAVEKVIAEYHVTVQEQVSPVVLNVSSVSPSPGSCKVTVTCSTQSSSLNSTFTCTHRICSEDGGDPAEVVISDVPLHFDLSNGSIVICNHSNKVSWSNATMEIKPNLCLAGNNPNYEILIILGRLVFVIPIIILVILYCWRKKNNHLKVHFDQSPNCHQAAAIYMNVSPLGSPTLTVQPADMEPNPMRP